MADQKLRILSLFSNCGGLDIGFLQTLKKRFKIVRAIEPDVSSTESYRINIVKRLEQTDILLQTGHPRDFAFEINEADIIIGAPPCAETLTQSNTCSLSRRQSPEVCDLVNTMSLSPIKRDSREDEDSAGNTGCKGGSGSNSEGNDDEMQDSTTTITTTKRKKTTGIAALKKKRKNALLMTEGSPSACSHATSIADNANDISGTALDNILRASKCVCQEWPVNPMPQSKGYVQWWCSAIYYKKKPKTLVSEEIVASHSTVSSNSSVYDADVENSDEDEYESAEQEAEEKPEPKKRGRKRKFPKKQTKKEQKQEQHENVVEWKSRFTEPSVARELASNEQSFDDETIFDYLNIVGRVRPLIFVLVLPPKIIENNDLETMYDEITRTASIYNYELEHVVLDASDFGVPQTRRRAFIIGRNRSMADCALEEFSIENDRFFIGPMAPRNTPIACGQVLRTLPPPGHGKNHGICKARVVPTRNTSAGLRGSAYAGQIFNGGGRPIDLSQPCNTFSRYIGGNFTPIVDQAHIDDESVEPWYEKYYRALREEDERAINALLPVPPNVRRLTVTEAKVLSGFDIDFELCGSHSARFRQVGGACAPQISMRVAQFVAQMCEEKKES